MSPFGYGSGFGTVAGFPSTDKTGEAEPDWLFRDTFSTAVPAPIGPTLAADVGSWTVQDDGDLLSVSDGHLNLVGANDYGNSFLRSADTFARAAGLAVYSLFRRATGVSWEDRFGFGPAGGGYSEHYWEAGRAAAQAGVYADVTGIGIIVDVDVERVIVLRPAGALYILREGGVWKLAFLTATVSTTPLRVTLFERFETTEHDVVNLLQLPAPFDTDDGLLTTPEIAAPVASAPFVHEADFVMELTAAGVYSEVYFRVTDASNYWLLLWDATDILVRQYTGGVQTLRIIGSRSGTDHVVLAVEGNVYRLFADGVLVMGTYTDATSQGVAATDGHFGLSVGGVTDVRLYPRLLTGDAVDALDELAG